MRAPSWFEGPHAFLAKCVLYSVLNAGSFMISMTFSSLAVPLTHMFNATSVHTFQLHDGGALLTSLTSAMIGVGCLLTILFVVPLADTMGRKFVCIELKFCLTSLSAICLFLSFFFQSSLAYGIGILLIQAPFYIRLMCDPIYLAELAEVYEAGHHQGFISMSVNTISVVVGATTALTLCREDIWGNDTHWYMVVLVAQGFNLALYLLGRKAMAESPQWLQGKKSNHLIMPSNPIERFIIARDILRNPNVRKVVFPILIVTFVNFWSPIVFEFTYPIQMYAKEGMQSDMVLTMTLITTVASVPWSCIGAATVDKFNRRTLVLCAIIINIVKSAMHITASFVPGFVLPYVNALLTRVLTGGGIEGMAFLMCAESLPPEDRVITSQMMLLVGLASQQIISISFPLLLNMMPFVFGFLILISIGLFFAASVTIQKRPLVLGHLDREKGDESEEKKSLLGNDLVLVI